MTQQMLTMLCFVSVSLFSVAQPYGNTSWRAAGIPVHTLSLPEAPSMRSYEKKGTEENTYTQGVFIVNEDWYGHQNSTVNFLTDKGEWIYRVFQKENKGHELGCTTQFGTIYGDKFYLVSKQQQDPGAKVKGSRFAVCDAKTMKVIKEFEFIATQTVKTKDGRDSLVSIADGRSYLPVDEQKGYIGTSNGIWIYDSRSMTIGKQIAGSGNPHSSGYGQLYYAQIGTMVRANDFVFAVHQQNGILVIDTKTDQIVRVIQAPIEKETVKGKTKDIQRGFGSIVRSKDGNLWISMAQNTLGLGGALSYMLKINPYTFKVDTIPIPLKEKKIGVIPNSWYAWTADGFCASTRENKLYWKGQDERGSWFTGYDIFCYDIDKQTFSKMFDIQAYPGKWRLYGTGFRIHPVTDDIYAFFYHDFQDPTHMLVRINSKGEMQAEYPMITNYWFPAIPVFPDNHPPVWSAGMPSSVELTDQQPQYKLYLGDKATDADNMEAAIVKSIVDITEGKGFGATIRNDSLILTVRSGAGRTQGNITLQFNSNGQFITHNIHVNVLSTSNQRIETPIQPFYNRRTGCIHIHNGSEISRMQVYDMQGRIMLSLKPKHSDQINVQSLPAGVYIIVVTDQSGQTSSTRFVK